jgi:hypothetical protein
MICLVVIATGATAVRADVAGDVAAGLSLTTVITNALNAGLTMQQAITQALAANADPALLAAAAVAASPAQTQTIIQMIVQASPSAAVAILNAVLGVTGVQGTYTASAITGALEGAPSAVLPILEAADKANVPQYVVSAAAQAANISNPAGALATAYIAVFGTSTGPSTGGSGGGNASPSR